MQKRTNYFWGEGMFRLISAFAFVVSLALFPSINRADDGDAKVTVKEVRAQELATFLKAQKGKVVVIDCWATWCAPCVKKFPHLVELHKKFGEKGLVCISLSMDKYSDEESYKKEKVQKFLTDKGATFPNFIASEPKKDEEELLKLIGDSSALPYMVMFDRAGKKVWASDDKKLTDEQLVKLIEMELAEKP
jgi:thiol-disulfide isomerase/thioredoxin